ncbi:Gfo/Idh/MocA family oxidoreductase [Pseudarthrobacter sulfonivorans]|uniref:Gfo/Idh/MocA family protein n=1 Tax=Pseudarthrobacter sulfonivorans TaxID=121292 RepID=UPI002862CB8C|nr:Gfo/Idh/MocA family oxidoreductase [Pseudarthrobacter sulfonivorans]MDR6417615.1 putative dehydrogenase [Pseudarthrobacter sulfonivorans]
MTESKVRFGVIGTTWYAETHLQNIQSHHGAELVAITGRDRAKATEVAGRFSIPHVYTDYRDMISAGNIDAIVIVAPDEMHLPITMDALGAGLHVLCEKPLATTAAAAQAMYERAETTGLKHMSFFALRTSMHHRYLRSLVEDGYLGQVYSAQFSLTHGFFRGDDYQWRFDAVRGTGALGDLGCYLIDQARWYVGDIARVSTSLRNTISRPHSAGDAYEPANDSAILGVEFRNGAHATMSTNVVAHQAERKQTNTVVLQGEGGTLELQHTFAGAVLRGARSDEDEFRVLEIPADLWEGVDPSNPGMVGQVHSVGDRAFIDAILNNEPITPSFYDGWKVQQVIETAFAANTSGSWESVPEDES